jgi:hypothetical protein
MRWTRARWALHCVVRHPFAPIVVRRFLGLHTCPCGLTWYEVDGSVERGDR